MDGKTDANERSEDSTTILSAADHERIAELETDRMMLDHALVKAMAYLIRVRNGELDLYSEAEVARYMDVLETAWDARLFARTDG